MTSSRSKQAHHSKLKLHVVSTKLLLMTLHTCVCIMRKCMPYGLVRGMQEHGREILKHQHKLDCLPEFCFCKLMVWDWRNCIHVSCIRILCISSKQLSILRVQVPKVDQHTKVNAKKKGSVSSTKDEQQNIFTKGDGYDQEIVLTLRC